MRRQETGLRLWHLADSALVVASNWLKPCGAESTGDEWSRLVFRLRAGRIQGGQQEETQSRTVLELQCCVEPAQLRNVKAKNGPSSAPSSALVLTLLDISGVRHEIHAPVGKIYWIRPRGLFIMTFKLQSPVSFFKASRIQRCCASL